VAQDYVKAREWYEKAANNGNADAITRLGLLYENGWGAIGDAKWYSKGKLPKTYNTPYRVISVERHVYQRAEGGKTFCPMDDGQGLSEKRPLGLQRSCRINLRTELRRKLSMTLSRTMDAVA
jgi:TPR repeat protein